MNHPSHFPRFALFVLVCLPLLTACGGRSAAVAAEPKEDVAQVATRPVWPTATATPIADAAPAAATPAAAPAVAAPAVAAPAVAAPAVAAPAAVAPAAAAPAVPARSSSGRTLPNRLVLPSIRVDIDVVELGWSRKTNQAGQVFSEWDVADFAAGWHKNSALPQETGNVVLSGHNNIKGAVFRELDQLQRGDKAILYVGATPYEYMIERVLIVPEKNASAEQRKMNASWILPSDDSRLTLVSCWPRDNNTHRIIVIAYPTGAQPAANPG